MSKPATLLRAPNIADRVISVTTKLQTQCVVATLLFTIITLSGHGSANADEPQHQSEQQQNKQHQAQQQLDAMRARILEIKQKLEADQAEKLQSVKQLRNIDLGLASQIKEMKTLERDIQQTDHALNTLAADIAGLNRSIQTHKKQLREQVRAAYLIGRQEYFKLILNQQNPTSTARTLTYYQYFYKARAAIIADINAQSTRLENNRSDLQAQQTSLERLKHQKSTAVEKLHTLRNQQKAAVVEYQRSIAQKNQQLHVLRGNEEQLLALLKELEHLPPAERQITASPSPPFAHLKGRLLWPAQGKLAAHYGSLRPAGSVKWKGVVIEGGRGEPVYAVAAGRIVFADWLRGFGMLLIIDHGENYMSLYGFNQVLHKGLGDWVEPDDIIAEIGNSGAQQLSGLYFEIRHNGVPQNPGQWCRTRQREG